MNDFVKNIDTPVMPVEPAKVPAEMEPKQDEKKAVEAPAQ